MEEIVKELPEKEIEELEERRLHMLEDAGITEGDVLDDAKKNLGEWNSYFTDNINRYKDDTVFLLQDQWSPSERGDFNRLHKPALTFNKSYDINKKIIGEYRKNKPALMVRSLNGRASQADIDLRADMIRTICYKSEHDLVFQQAFTSAVNGGFGAFEVGYDYMTPMSFYQDIMFKLIPDPLLTAFDPAALKPHKGDGDFCSRIHLLSQERFDAMYPYITDPVSYRDIDFLSNLQWRSKKQVAIADYYRKVWYPVKIFQLSNGLVVTEDQWEKMQKDMAEIKMMAEGSLVVGDMIMDELPKVLMERMTSDYTLRHYRLTNNKIIDFMDFPSRYLPIIFVDGDSAYSNGQQITRSFTHNSKDAQRAYNYVKSETIAEIKNRRREQWLVTEDMIIGHEQMWRNPEVQVGALIAKADPKTGMMPTKMTPWELPQSLIVEAQALNQDIREITGFSEQMELQGRDISGKARRERKTEGAMAAYVYFDNLNQAIEQAGRVVLDLLPVIYGDENRPMVLNKQDGNSNNVILNQKDEKTNSVKNALSKGEFDVEIDSGPSFAVQKEIAIEFLQETLAANPQVFPLIADIWARQLDVQFQKQLVDRLKTLVPPEIIAEEEGQPPPPPKPNPQAQLLQMEMQEKQQQLQERAAELQLRSQKQQQDAVIDAQKREVEKAKLQMDVQKMLADIQMNERNHNAEQRKADMNATIELTKILADLQKDRQQKAE